jgi:hypothetical protein
MVRDIERKVVSATEATRDNMEREAGISSSVDDEDIKKYVQEVLHEVKSGRDRTDSDRAV